MTSVDTVSGDPVKLLKQLIEIPSVNPDVDSTGDGEAAIADFIYSWFNQRGFSVQRLEERPGRPSIVAVARGTGGGKTLMFNGHIDTVGVANYEGCGFLAKEADGRVYGRGSCEMKAGVAAMMIAADNIRRQGVAGDVIVACVADQEGSAWGTQEVLRSYRADGAIVPEPSDLELTVCHKGLMWFDVVVKGKSAHGSRPDLGIDAICKSGKFLVALEI
jgi:acetylornithine deacetylase